jgi:hypothetical protein
MEVVFPSNDEKTYVDMVKKLGFSSLCLVYPFYKAKEINGIKKELTDFNIEFGLIVNPNQISKAKKYSKFVFIQSSHSNRWVLEKNRNIILFDVEKQPRKDFMHHRNSGLNQVLCKLANQNHNMIAFAFSHLIANMPVLLGRISQNIKLCRKYKVNMMLASFADSIYKMRAYHDMLSFAKVMGMHPKEAKNALEK